MKSDIPQCQEYPDYITSVPSSPHTCLVPLFFPPRYNSILAALVLTSLQFFLSHRPSQSTTSSYSLFLCAWSSFYSLVIQVFRLPLSTSTTLKAYDT